MQHHDNYERPNQALSGGNRPPRVAHPDRPPRPAIPDVVAVPAWLERFAGVGITRAAAGESGAHLVKRPV